MKMLIVGAGAMGCYMGAVLTAAGQDVILYDTDTAKMMLLDCRGIYLEEPDGQLQIVQPQTRQKIEEIEPVDAIILLVKGYNTYAAARNIAELANCQPDIISLQNGMGNMELLAERFPAERLFAGVTYQGAYEISPGNIVHTGSGPTYLAPMAAGREDAARTYASLLAASGIPAEAVPHQQLEHLLWQKLLVNAAINPLSAIYRVCNGALVEDETMRQEMMELAREGVAIAQAKGIDIEFEELWQSIEETCRNTAENHSSMLVDVERGRNTEIELINGGIIWTARELGMRAPAHEKVMLRFQERYPQLPNIQF